MKKYLKAILTVGFLIVMALFFYFDLDQYGRFDLVKRELDQWQAWSAASPLQAGALYFLLYVLVTALSLPGAAILTLLGGALFGLWYGLFLVSFSSSIGASLAFLLARFIFRDLIETRWPHTLETINAGVEREGSFYLFAMRLVPLFPFFLINILLALTKMRLWTFYWVSQLGMLAGTVVYVNAGEQLASLRSPADIVSFPLLLSFALLGVFPFIARRMLDVIKQKRSLARWKAPKQFDRNLIVIGAGAGGLVTAYIAAVTRAKVTLVEANAMGGDCLNTGCVPSKALIHCAKVASTTNTAGVYGVKAHKVDICFKTVMDHVDRAIQSIEPHDSVARYESLGVEVRQGHARLIDPWTVAISTASGEQQCLTARAIVLATGASPVIPDIPGLQECDYVTSDTLWQRLRTMGLPKRLIIFGGGVIGCEMAQAFARLGSVVTVIDRNTHVLHKEDQDLSMAVEQALQQAGVTLHLSSEVLSCHSGDRPRVTIAQAERTFDVDYDLVLVAVGRQPRLSGYGLEALGLCQAEGLPTNQYLQTILPHLYAVGDLVGPHRLTHAAAHQAWYAAVNGLFGQFKRFAIDDRVMPYCIFTDPEVARVGLNERQAQQQQIQYEKTIYELCELDRAITEGQTQGFVKVLTKPGSDQILGVTMVGARAGDVISEFVLAMKLKKGLNSVLSTVHAYPTWAESNKFVAGQWKRRHAPEIVLQLVSQYHLWRLGTSVKSE